MRVSLVRLVTALCGVVLTFAACGSDAVEVGADDHWIDGSSVDDAPATAAEFDATVEAQATPSAPPDATEVPVPAAPSADNDGLFPTVVEVRATRTDDQSWRFDVTLLSEYDSPARYADAWRVLDANDNELGIRVLGHDHANEQPFTRSTTVEVPADITTVYIEGRDQLNGWSGERIELELAGDISGTIVDHAN